MNEFTLDELNLLIAVFDKAGIAQDSTQEGELLARLKDAQESRQEIEDMQFDDCLGGACKL